MKSLAVVVAVMVPVSVWAQGAPVPPEVEFNRDIRPIFSDKCYTCHGPDKANRKSKLRFDTEAGATQDLGGRFAIVQGDTGKSELIRRIFASNPDDQCWFIWCVRPSEASNSPLVS